MTADKKNKQEKNLNQVFLEDVNNIVSRFVPNDAFGGTSRPGKTILDDVLTLSKEAHEKESEQSRIASLFFTMGSDNPLWFVGNSPKRVLSDFDPERDDAICKDIVPEGKTPADGFLKRLGYAHRVYAKTDDGDYVSATIDVDIDISLLTPVSEYQKTGRRGKLDQLIRQSVLGKKDRNWRNQVEDAIKDLVESDRIKETPYWSLKKAFEYFANGFHMNFLPVVEVDPVSLKAHFTLYTGYMPMKVHQELTRIISETFFKGMYDEALNANNRSLALSRVGSMSKSDGLNGKFLHRRFLWSFSEPSKVAVFAMLTRLGFWAPKASDEKISEIRSLAMENGVQVNRGREYQYRTYLPSGRPVSTPASFFDAYVLNAYAHDGDMPKLFSTISHYGDGLFLPIRFAMEYAAAGQKPWIYGRGDMPKSVLNDDVYYAIMLGEKKGWPRDMAERRAFAGSSTKLCSPSYLGHLIDYNEENEPTEDDDRPVRRRRRRRIVGDESPAPAAAKDNGNEDDDRPVRRRRRRAPEAIEAPAPVNDAAEDDLDEDRPVRRRRYVHPAERRRRREIEEGHAKASVSVDDDDLDDLLDEDDDKPARPVRRRRATEDGHAKVPTPATDVEDEAPVDADEDEEARLKREQDELDRLLDDWTVGGSGRRSITKAIDPEPFPTPAPAPAPAPVDEIDEEEKRLRRLRRRGIKLDGRPRRRRRAPEAIEAPAPVVDDKYPVADASADTPSVATIMSFDEEVREEYKARLHRDIRRKKEEALAASGVAKEEIKAEIAKLEAIVEAISMAEVDLIMDEWTVDSLPTDKPAIEPPAEAAPSVPSLPVISDASVNEDDKNYFFKKYMNIKDAKERRRARARAFKGCSRFNDKAHRIGIEALYAMMAKGQNCRFGGLFGDPARKAALMAFAFIVSNKNDRLNKEYLGDSDLQSKGYYAAINSICKTIQNMGYDIFFWSANKLAKIILDTALYGMGQEVRDLALDVTNNARLSEEWMSYFEIGLRQMEHPIVSDEFADPYAVRMRHLKIRMPNGKTLDPLSNVRLKGNGKVSPREFVDLAGAVLNFDVTPLHKLPEKAAMNAALRAMAERPEIHYKKRDLRENAVYVAKLMEAAEKGFRPALTPEEYARNTAEFRHRRMDAIRRSHFILEDHPITPEQAWEIVKVAKGDTYNSSTESFTAIMSLTKDMLGDKGNKYDNAYEIGDDIVRSDGHWTAGDMALLKALLAVHVETLSRLGKVNLLGSSRGFDFSVEFGRDWNDPEVMKTPWDGKLLAKEFAYITREMSITSHDDVIAQDKRYAELAFAKTHPENQEQLQRFENGTPNFLLPSDIDVTPYSSVKAIRNVKLFRTDFIMAYGLVDRSGSAAYKEACQIFEPFYTFRYRNGGEEKMGMQQFEQGFNLDDILNGKIYMAANFTRNFGYEFASGKIDQLPCPSSSFLQVVKDEEGKAETKSVVNSHYIPDETFKAAALILSIMQNKRRLSFDRAIKGLHSLDKFLGTREYDGSIPIPFSSRYFSMKSGINHNECNRLLQDLAAIGLIDRSGGKLQGTLLGPAETEKERAVQELCEQVGPGVIGQARATKQDFVENGQFLSTYTKFHKDGFAAEKDGEAYRFTAKEIIEGFENLDGATDSDNPLMIVIESACHRLDAAVDRLRDFTYDELRKSNLFEIRMDYVLSKVEKLTTDQFRKKASAARESIVSCLGYVAPSRMGCLTDVEDAFRHTSKLYKGRDSELMRTYGYWLSRLMNSRAIASVTERQIRREFSNVIRFVNGRSGVLDGLLNQISSFTTNIRQVEIASRSWKAYVADLTASAREFRRSYLALLGAVSKAAKAPYSGDLDIPSLVSSGTPIKTSS